MFSNKKVTILNNGQDWKSRTLADHKFWMEGVTTLLFRENDQKNFSNAGMRNAILVDTVEIRCADVEKAHFLHPVNDCDTILVAKRQTKQQQQPLKATLSTTFLWCPHLSTHSLVYDCCQ